MRYYHGGQTGLHVGDFLLPPTVSGVLAGVDYMPAGSPLAEQAAKVRRDRVYLTRETRVAEMFAALHPSGTEERGGDVYEAVPVGEVEPDPDCNVPGESWQCERARIRRVVTVGVPREPWLPLLSEESA